MKNCIRLSIALSMFLMLINLARSEITPFITRAAWVPGSNKLLIVNNQQRPLLWDSVAECPLYFHYAHKNEVIAVTVSDSARLAVTSTSDRELKIWDVATGAEIHKIVGIEYPSSAIVFTDDSRLMLLGDWGGSIRLWNVEEFLEKNRFKAFDSAVFSIALYYPKRLVVAGSGDGEVLLRDLQIEKDIARFTAHRGPVTAIEITADGRAVVSAGEDGYLLIWHYMDDIKDYIKLSSEPILIQSIDISPDSQYILVGTKSGMMYLVDLKARKINFQFKLSDTALQLVKFKNNSEAVLVDNDYRIWNFVLPTQSLKSVSEASGDVITPRSMESFIGSNWIESMTGMEFTWVEGGCFDIGCSLSSDVRGCASDNTPAKNICVNDYWMSKYEVSSKSWQQVIGKEATQASVDMPLINQRFDRNEIKYVSGISWGGAQNFICRFNRITGGDFRLPSEAEWEYACNKSIETKRLTQLELIDKDYDISTQTLNEKISDDKVDDKMGSDAVDIRGMHSGVSEWVLDVYNRFGYEHDRRYNPLFVYNLMYYFYGQQVSRVKRGGGWDTGHSVLECKVRQYNDQESHDYTTGIRLISTKLSP